MTSRPVPKRTALHLARVRQLRAERDRATKAMADHAKLCPSCHGAISITGAYCDAGWILAKAKARAIYNWDTRDRITPTTPTQETLF